MTARDHESLLAREKPAYDGAEPSGNSVEALNLLRLHELTTDDRYRRRAERTLEAFARGWQRHVCERRVCRLPTSDPEVFARQIQKVDSLQGVSEP